jgi:soluble lytic murein transglycosylase
MARTKLAVLGAALLGGIALPLVVAGHIAAEEIAAKIAARDGVAVDDVGLGTIMVAVVRHGAAVFDGITSDGATIDGLTTASLPTPAALPRPGEAAPDATPTPAMFSPGFMAPPKRLIEPQAGQPSPDAPLVRSVIELYRKGDVGAADLAASTVQDPALRAVLEWAAIRLQPRQVGFARIMTFLADNPDWPGRNGLRRRAEEALVSERRDPKSLLAFFAEKAPLTPQGRYAYAKALTASGRAAEAGTIVRELWRKDDLSAETEAKVLADFPGVLQTADHRARVERELFSEDWKAAERNAARLGNDVVRLVKARVAVDGNAGNAGTLLDALPASLKSDPSLLFARAQWLRRKDKPVDAAKLIAGMTRDTAILVNAGEWWTERRVLARKLLDLGEQKLAYEVARNYPLGDPAVTVEAEFHAGWIALRFLADKSAAARHFAAAAAVATTPISVARATYWQGRAAEALGEDPKPFYERAADAPTTYYGQLARARLGLTDLPVRRVVAPSAPPLDRLAAARAIRLLGEAGARDLAAPLYSELANSLASEADLDALASLAAEQGDARALLSVGKTAVQRGFPLDNHAFPLIGVPAFDLPDQGGIDRSLVYAIARQESAFDPKAVSSAGALGLMQLMPATAKATAIKAGLGWEPDRLGSDAAYNARIGATHLCDLVADWKGSYILTIASYNAGPGNVRKWIEAYGDPRSSGIDPIDWVERIPFTETRNYVQRVMENLQVYRSRLGERSTLLIDTDMRRGQLR